jgi:uncharacterized damage-inducible protein DinB
MNQGFFSFSPSVFDPLPATAVERLARIMQAMSDGDLGQPWAWGPHAEGVRFALLGTYQELRELAVRLGQERRITAPLSTAQHVLGQYHAAYRDLLAHLIGVDDDLAARRPRPNDWSVRETLGHIVRTERGFYTLVHYGLRRQREDDMLPERLPEGEVERQLESADSFQNLLKNGDLHEIMAYYGALHGRILGEFAGMTDQELRGPSLWWEDIRFPLQHRLHRFDAHLRQHTGQIEMALAALGQEATESRRLLRIVYTALAEVEALLIGAPDLAVTEREALAETIQARSIEIDDRLQQIWRLQTAVFEGDTQTVSEILSYHPALADTLDDSGLPLILSAVYRGQPAVAAIFEEKGAELSIFEAAALGNLAVVQREAQAWPEDVTAYGLDGFTALQLACYFGQEAIARWLVEQGAEVSAVSRNDQALQAIHAAVANNSLPLCRLLLENDADANARQNGGFTPLHAAAQNGNEELVVLLLASGADASLAGDQGETAVSLARAAGHGKVAERIEQEMAK